jgi:hypothetical protein
LKLYDSNEEILPGNGLIVIFPANRWHFIMEVKKELSLELTFIRFNIIANGKVYKNGQTLSCETNLKTRELKFAS